MSDNSNIFDIFVIGGGINGCGIARDASGRGLKVALAEMNDLASATSSASTKLFHGGLRYLEYFEFRLVREALIEREVLLSAMPHISWPMRFVLPVHRDMRFEATTALSRVLGAIMPWQKGRRPDWLIRLGLFLYDHLGGRKVLPGTRVLDLADSPEGEPLQSRFKRAFEYSDCWVDDARLVVLNARDAAARGAVVLVGTRVVAAERRGGNWEIEVEDAVSGDRSVFRARALVNAAGPWVGQVIRNVVRSNSTSRVRLVRGSHIVTARLYEHEKCYFFQGRDGRIIFAIPYEQDFTLIGTTDVEHPDPDASASCSPSEIQYLLDFANQYFSRQLTEADVVWTYSGVRPLFDDGSDSASAATRDYTLKVDATDGAPLLDVFGGKITTYRRLAESALSKLAPYLDVSERDWTAGVPLPGGDFDLADKPALAEKICESFPFIERRTADRFIRTYGTDATLILEPVSTRKDMGRHFGADLWEVEVRWLIKEEFARSADDVLWRRTKLGLRFSQQEAAELDAWIKSVRS